jgi:hypothetical protein
MENPAALLLTALLLTAEELAAELRVTYEQIRHRRMKGFLPCLRMPNNSYRYSRADIDAWKESRWCEGRAVSLRRSTTRRPTVETYTDKASVKLANPDIFTPVEYAPGMVCELPSPSTCLQSGVYLLFAWPQFYIGQSRHIPGRFATHLSDNTTCELYRPRCTMLAEVPFRNDLSETKNNRLRLNAEA